MAQRFRLQSVLEMRERQEELRQQELAALLHQQRMAEEALGLLERQLAEQQRALAARGRGLLDVPAVRHSLAFIEGKRQAIAAQHAWAAELEAGSGHARPCVVSGNSGSLPARPIPFHPGEPGVIVACGGGRREARNMAAGSGLKGSFPLT